MTKKNFVDESVSYTLEEFDDRFKPSCDFKSGQGYPLHVDPDLWAILRENLEFRIRSELQSFARKVVEEGKKISDEYSRRHEYPTAPLLEFLDYIRSLSGLSREDNQHKE